MTVAVQQVLVADHDDGLRRCLSELVGSLGLLPVAAATGSEALARAEDPEVVLALLSLDLASPCGYEVLHRMRARYGETLPIAVLSADNANPRDEVASLLLGADHYFTKPLQNDLFVARVRRLMRQPATSTTHPRIAASADPPHEPNRTALTNRESQVLALLVRGHRTADIAARLCITRKTAATHIERILPKLGAHSQAQAVAFALRDGLVQDPGPATRGEAFDPPASGLGTGHLN